MIYNLMPEVFWIGPLIVTLILRPAVALALVVMAIRTVKRTPAPHTAVTWSVTLVQGGLALLFLFGLFTQYAALLGFLFTGFLLATKKFAPSLYRESVVVYILLDAVFLSLLVTGAGPLSLDSPL